MTCSRYFVLSQQLIPQDMITLSLQIIISKKKKEELSILANFFIEDEGIESKLKHLSFWLIQRHQLFLSTYYEFPVPQLWNSRNAPTLCCILECMRINETQLKFTVCNDLGGTAKASWYSLKLSEALLEVCLQMLKSFTCMWIAILSVNTRKMDTFTVFCSKTSSKRSME